MATLIKSMVICVLCCMVLLDTCYGHIYGEKSVAAGGRRPISTDDPQVMALSHWAAKRLGGVCTSVTGAEQQVVSGLMYYIKFIMKESGKKFSCQIAVWMQPWHRRTQLMEHRCVREGHHSQLA